MNGKHARLVRVPLRMFTLANLTTPPWLVDGGKGCLQQDAHDCVAEAGCGFCAWSLTCMPGDASGPLPGSLPCDPEHGWESWPAQVAWLNQSAGVGPHGGWAFTEEQVKAQHVKPFRPFSAPPEWDIMCEAGGQRHYQPCHAKGCTQTGMQPYSKWQSGRCACPAERSGKTCGGCASDAGCAAGQSCERRLGVGPDADMKMSCTLIDTDPSYAMGLVEQFADNVSIYFALTRERGFEYNLTNGVQARALRRPPARSPRPRASPPSFAAPTHSSAAAPCSLRTRCTG